MDIVRLKIRQVIGMRTINGNATQTDYKAQRMFTSLNRVLREPRNDVLFVSYLVAIPSNPSTFHRSFPRQMWICVCMATSHPFWWMLWANISKIYVIGNWDWQNGNTGLPNHMVVKQKHFDRRNLALNFESEDRMTVSA